MSRRAEMDLVGGDGSPASAWDQDVEKRAFDDLFHNAAQYRSSKVIHDLFRFVGRFRFYTPFNAMLVHMQMLRAIYVTPAHRWRSDYGRPVRAGVQPLMILQPMGPVMFVFDVAETEALPNAPPLPPKVEKPFEVTSGRVGGELEATIENAKRDGILVEESAAGSQHAGSIHPVPESPRMREGYNRVLYTHPNGAVVWINLNEAVAAQVQANAR